MAQPLKIPSFEQKHFKFPSKDLSYSFPLPKLSYYVYEIWAFKKPWKTWIQFTYMSGHSAIHELVEQVPYVSCRTSLSTRRGCWGDCVARWRRMVMTTRACVIPVTFYAHLLHQFKYDHFLSSSPHTIAGDITAVSFKKSRPNSYGKRNIVAINSSEIFVVLLSKWI